MNIGILEKTTVIDTAVFDDIETASQFLKDGVWETIEADNVIELPEGFGIGDNYINGKWINNIQDSSALLDSPLFIEPIIMPELAEYLLELEYKLINIENGGKV